MYFADARTNVYALDVRDGEVIWKTKVGVHQESSVTGSVAVFDGRVYVPLSSMEVAMALDATYECCTSSGEVVAVDAETGEEIWRRRVISEEAEEVGKTGQGKRIMAPSGAPVWSSPTVDTARGLL